MPKKFKTVKEFGEFLLAEENKKSDSCREAPPASNNDSEVTVEESSHPESSRVGETLMTINTNKSVENETPSSSDFCNPESSAVEPLTKTDTNISIEKETPATSDSCHPESPGAEEPSVKQNTDSPGDEKAENKRSKLKFKVIASSSQSHHVLFYDPELMEQFSDHEIFCDGTFDARPKISNCNQLFTILARKYNVVSFNSI